MHKNQREFLMVYIVLLLHLRFIILTDTATTVKILAVIYIMYLAYYSSDFHLL